MPIYEYRCSACGHKFELIQRFSDPPRAECPRCGGEAHRIISLAGFVLKGSGWYITDYPSEARKKAMKEEQKMKESAGAAAGGGNGAGESAKTKTAAK
jgi:putative FmdB family regulatory protein